MEVFVSAFEPTGVQHPANLIFCLCKNSTVLPVTKLPRMTPAGLTMLLFNDGFDGVILPLKSPHRTHFIVAAALAPGQF
jgi:hypothetical protein